MPKKNYVIDILSDSDFKKVIRDFAGINNLLTEGERITGLFPFLFQDIFYALYEPGPKLLSLDRITTGARLNHLIISQFLKNREFKRVRKFTRQNATGAGILAMYFVELVISSLDQGIFEVANEIYCTEAEYDDALRQIRVAEKIAGIAEMESGQDIARLYRASVIQWNDIAGEKQKQLRALAARLNLLWNTSDQRNGAVPGDQATKGQEGQFESGAEGFGENKGVWARGDLSPHLKLVHTYANSAKLKRLVQRVGRLKEVKEQRQGRQNMDNNIEVRGIDYGNDLTMVIPEEWAEFFSPGKQASFRKKFADESLCVYDMKGKNRQGKGSLIICLDNSGSMQGPKEETSKAIAVALMEIAMAQKRNFVVIMFGGPEDEPKVFEVPQGRCTFQKLVEIGEFFLCSSGTDFEKPLQEAMRYLEKDKYPGGDIVFITDGVCNVSPEFLESYKLQKKAKKFRTIGVLVNYGQVSTAPVEAFCDELLKSKDLKGTDIAGELFAKMRR